MDSHEDTPMGFWGSESESVIARQYPIHKACRDGDAVTLSRAVAVASPDQLVAEDQFYGWTPVHWAAYFGKVECLNGLLRTGVNVNIRTSRFQQTPAHIAAFGGHPTCLLELLKSGADFHARDYLGETPMHKAARVGNGECIKTLIQNGARANICNNNGHTAADLSRMQNFKECVNILDAASGQLAAQVSYNGLNGSHVLNGSSGCHVTNGNGFVTNGHNNGTNGHHNNGVTNRKRSYEDESIPLFKRARVADKLSKCIPVKIKAPSKLDEWASMECDIESYPVTPPEYQNINSTEACFRAPSPGMDFRVDEDMQLWCHMHGYGDTAESLSEDEHSIPRYKLKGIQTTGWC
nr:ankyrin repeat domain-containing protein 10 isoform X2 [Ciona intestinalis]|eukprot:XP_002123436.3 ankyrin repeat domain-containing protein 10 isoform X2 [Ciona intestinalis]